jgi:hypothetical protein
MDVDSQEFKEKAAAMTTLVTDLAKKVDTIRIGGGKVARDRHVARKV